MRGSIDLTLPLCQGRLVSLNDEKQVWISFKHEILPNVCYWCGRITHDDRDCELWIESEGTLKSDQREFSPGLRAPPFVVSRKNVITVPGYYSSRKKDNIGNASQTLNDEQPTQPYHTKSPTVPEKRTNGERYK